MNGNNNFFDILNLASLILGIQNLNENRAQSAQNDVQTANQAQAEFLLGEIHQEFAEIKKLFMQQNETLHKIVAALNEIQKAENIEK